MKGVQPIVIVSTGRTGTGFLADLLQRRVPQADAHHITPHSTWINLLSNAYLAGLLSKGLLVRLARALKGRHLQRCGKAHFVDSNNHLYALVAVAPEVYPGLKVVHVVRDPRTYVRSHLNWARQRRKSFFANYLLPLWQPNAFLIREMSLSQWLSLSRFERFCWIWDFKNRFIETLAGSGTPYLRVRFEDLFEDLDPEPHFRRLFEFMELPAPDELRQEVSRPHNETRVRPHPGWREWHPRQCARLHALCGSKMADYGYGVEDEWLEKVRAGRARIPQRRAIGSST